MPRKMRENRDEQISRSDKRLPGGYKVNNHGDECNQREIVFFMGNMVNEVVGITRYNNRVTAVPS